MSRKTMRALTIIILLGMAAWMFELAGKGWTFNGLVSTRFMGYMLAAGAVLDSSVSIFGTAGPWILERIRPSAHQTMFTTTLANRPKGPQLLAPAPRPPGVSPSTTGTQAPIVGPFSTLRAA